MRTTDTIIPTSNVIFADVFMTTLLFRVVVADHSEVEVF